MEVSRIACSGEKFAMRLTTTFLTIALVTGKLTAQEPSEASVPTAERVEFRVDGRQRIALGNILVEAEDGGILLESRNQTIWPLQPNEIVSRRRLDEDPKPLSRKELANAIQSELGSGFRIHETKHYIICYNTSTDYVRWCGAMFERLHRAFHYYWERRGIKLHKTPPLVACVFRNKKSYEDYGRPGIGETIKSILGYYSNKSNRIAMYDLTAGQRLNSAAITRYMRTERTVATIIHEATHQLAFNTGMHQRYADIPLWLSEGLAIYFETPDLNSSKGWKTIGKVNQVRLRQFAEYTKHRRSDSLLTLIATDDRFQRLGLASEAYAESWAFCYYLIKHHARDFSEYLRILQAKDPLVTDTQESRLADFVQAFGKPPQEMNRDFLRRVSKLRPR